MDHPAATQPPDLLESPSLDLHRIFGAEAAARLANFRSRHALASAGLVLAVFGGFGAVAVAVAPLAPDAANLPSRLVSEEVATVDLPSQLEALAAHGVELWRSDLTRSGDSMETVLRRLGIVDAEAVRHGRADTTIKRALDGRVGRVVRVRGTENGELVELVVLAPADSVELARTHFTRLTLSRADGRWVSRQEIARLSAEARLGSGTIRSTLFAATDEARLPDAVATQLAEIFATDIDFHRELRRGDTFSVVYEALTADGEPVPWAHGGGRVLAAEFVNAGTTRQAIWFEGAAAGKGAFFDAQGRSRKRSFLASPLEFSRVSSGFAMRMHPIMQRWRAHLGVDYAAPAGTPVRSVGDGVVELAGWQNGYGNVVHIKHSNDRTTVFAHLSRVDVRQGQRVEQNQRIGAVGATGWATGPHLHFEFRVGGVHHDPLKIAKASEPIVLDPAAKSRFAEVAQAVQVKLDVAESIGGVRASFE